MIGNRSPISVTFGAVDVEVMRWPAERLAVDDLRAKGIARLLLLEVDEPVPEMYDCLEDWARLPLSDSDLYARRTAVAARAKTHAVAPTLDDTGVARFRDRWVALSPVERDLAAGLIERFGTLVSRELLSERAWPDVAHTRNALDVHVLRLRKRLRSIGLEMRTVRARGYLLQALEMQPDPQQEPSDS